VRNLFRAERSWFESLVDRMREVAKRLPGPPKAVWIEGPIAAESDSLGDPITLGVLSTSRELPDVLAALEDPIDQWSDDLDVTVEPRGLTLPDLEALTEKERDPMRHVIPVLGPPPLLLAGRWKVVSRKPRSHADLDMEARARAEAIADQLKSNPALVKRALVELRKRIAKASPGERHELREWERILTTTSLPRLRRLLADAGERATRLRQTMPFEWVLSSGEQLDVAMNTRLRKQKR
jgi:hypothetical protein